MAAVAESAPTIKCREEPRTAKAAIGSSSVYRPVTTGIPAIFAYPRTSGMPRAARVTPTSRSPGSETGQKAAAPAVPASAAASPHEKLASPDLFRLPEGSDGQSCPGRRVLAGAGPGPCHGAASRTGPASAAGPAMSIMPVMSARTGMARMARAARCPHASLMLGLPAVQADESFTLRRGRPACGGDRGAPRDPRRCRDWPETRVPRQFSAAVGASSKTPALTSARRWPAVPTLVEGGDPGGLPVAVTYPGARSGAAARDHVADLRLVTVARLWRAAGAARSGRGSYPPGG
jgi:hypothetical protein